MDVAASEFYKEDKSYDLNFKEDVSSLLFLFLYCHTNLPAQKSQILTPFSSKLFTYPNRLSFLTLLVLDHYLNHFSIHPHYASCADYTP
jgi:hypothetical protein